MGKAQDLTGMRFERLLVLGLNEEESQKPRGKDGRKIKHYNCLCDCGNTCIVRGQQLKSGHTSSCGCIQKEKASRSKRVDVIGRRFGKLVIVGDDGTRSGTSVKWLCQCDCGNTTHAVLRELGKSTFSCGCERRERARRHMSEMASKQVGEFNPRYNPNLTDEERKENESRMHDKKWRECAKRTKERDNYTCDCCKKQGEVVSHHKNGWNNFKEQRYDDDNIITLCLECHRLFHKTYGYGNNTEEQYLEFKALQQ